MGEGFQEGFNTIVIPVNDGAEAIAKKAEELGWKIIFDLELGLFSASKMPLESEALFSSLRYDVTLFKTSLLEKFSAITLGVIAYKGTADFYAALKSDYSLADSFSLWQEEHPRHSPFQGYFEMGLKFIERVTEAVPANFPIFVLLDFQNIQDSSLKAFMLNRERLGRILLVPKNADALYLGMKWEGPVTHPHAYFGTNPNPPQILENQKTHAILLPSLTQKQLSYQAIGEAIDFLESRGTPFRLVPEGLFISEWDEINKLLVPEIHSKEAARMLSGFIASEGEVVVLKKGWKNDWKD